MSIGSADAEASGPASKKRKTGDMTAATDDAAASQRFAKIVEIVPEADVTIRVGTGEEAIDIKASSVVLSLASRVFKAMLNGHFIEGTTKIMSLEDEPQTVLDYCHIIHHRHDAVVGNNADRLRNLIVFAEMRQSLETIRPWISLTLYEYLRWFENLPAARSSEWEPSPNSYPGLLVEDFLSIAFLFKLQDLFWQATFATVMVTANKTVVSSGSLLKRFPSITDKGGICLSDILYKVRTCHIQSLLKQVSQAIRDGFKPRLVEGRPWSALTLCAYSQEKYGAFVSWLIVEDIDICDTSAYLGSWWTATRSVLSAARNEEFDDPDSGPNNEDWSGNCATLGCQYCGLEKKEELREIVDRETWNLPGICLKCFLENGKASLLNHYCTRPGHSKLAKEEIGKAYNAPSELDLS